MLGDTYNVMLMSQINPGSISIMIDLTILLKIFIEIFYKENVLTQALGH